MSQRTVPSALTLPIYSYAESDYLAKVTRGTSARWLKGYKYRARDGGVIEHPPVSPLDSDQPGVAFVDLVEVVVINALRDKGFSLGKVRQIVTDCEELFGTPYPIASREFETDGREIYVRRANTLVGLLSNKWKVAWRDLLHPFLKQIDYREGFAARWWPMGHDAQIVVDPEYGFGLPVIAGTGYRTEIIAEWFEHELEDDIAKELSIPVLQVQRALQFEISRRPTAA